MMFEFTQIKQKLIFKLTFLPVIDSYFNGTYVCNYQKYSSINNLCKTFDDKVNKV